HDHHPIVLMTVAIRLSALVVARQSSTGQRHKFMKRETLAILGLAVILMPAAFGQVGGGGVGCPLGVGNSVAGPYMISTFAGGGPPNGAPATSIAISNV